MALHWCTGTELYQEVKRATDSFCGIPSQCFVSSNAGVGNPAKLRGRPQYAANVALKASSPQLLAARRSS